MVQPVRLGKKKRRPLPPGQKLVLLLLLCWVSSTVTMWLLKPFCNAGAQLALLVPQFVVNNSANAATPVQAVPLTAPAPFELKEELKELSDKVKQHCNKPKLRTGVFVVEPDSGRFIDVDGRRAYPAASMIKLPVLIELLQAIDNKTADLNQKIVIRKDLQGGGSGWLQYRPAGSAISLKECTELMIIISDNTATNMIIDLLGGKEILNADFLKIGLTQTRINNALPDLTGTNTTSPYDLALLLGKIDSGQLLSPEMRAWMLSVLERNKIRTLLPQGLPQGTKIADKTGDIAGLVGDAGIITTKEGKRYIATVAVERPWNDRRANQLIRTLSKEIYVGVTGDVEGVRNVLVPAVGKPGVHGRRHRHSNRHRNRTHRAR